jgi:hypothetical protein
MSQGITNNLSSEDHYEIKSIGNIYDDPELHQSLVFA